MLSSHGWAEHPTDKAGSFLRNAVAGSDGNGSVALYIRHWLSDTAIYQDAVEIVAEKARRYWWGQQIDLAMVSWALLLAIEGRRRSIPFLWAYFSLAYLVNLSFAQNLFFVALLLTPSPLPQDGTLVPTR